MYTKVRIRQIRDAYLEYYDITPEEALASATLAFYNQDISWSDTKLAIQLVPVQEPWTQRERTLRSMVYVLSAFINEFITDPEAVMDYVEADNRLLKHSDTHINMYKLKNLNDVRKYCEDVYDDYLSLLDEGRSDYERDEERTDIMEPLAYELH